MFFICLLVPAMSQAQVQWVNDFSGLFDDDMNWSNGSVPQSNDIVVFNRGGQGIEVFFTQDAEISSLRMRRGDFRFYIPQENTFYIQGSQDITTSVGGWSQEGGGFEPGEFDEFEGMPESVRLTVASGTLHSKTIAVGHQSGARGTLTASGSGTLIKADGLIQGRTRHSK